MSSSYKNSFYKTEKAVSLALLSLIGIGVAATPSDAQVTAAEDGTATIVEAEGNLFDISGGQISDDDKNLFHSFEGFDLNASETANFIVLPTVENVLGRIVGGASSIDGTLQIIGSEANLYLMNSTGILIGPNARINLTGGFTATTATGIWFDNDQFGARANNNYSDLNGSPTAFQFDHSQAGAVVNFADLSVGSDQAISLVGGTVVNAGSLSAPAGSINIAAVEGEAVVRISQGNRLLSLEVEADGTPSQTAAEITPESIGEMLTGSGLENATDLVRDADGTVRLRSTARAIDESGGEASNLGALDTQGDVGGVINVVGDRIELGQNNDAIRGATLSIQPSSVNRDISIGAEGATDSESVLEIREAELSAIGNGVDGISIGRADSTGEVRLSSGVKRGTRRRSPLNILGGQTLIGPDTDNIFRLTGSGSGTLAGLNNTRFEGIDSLTGGRAADTFYLENGGEVPGSLRDLGGSNTLNYREYGSPIELLLAGETVVGTGVVEPLRVDNVVGSRYTDTLRGSESDDSFLITRRSGALAGSVNSALNFSSFEVFDGQEGANTFELNAVIPGTGLEVIGGSDRNPNSPDGVSNNRIITDTANSLWRLAGRNLGELRQRNETIATFSEIQHLETNEPTSRQHTVLFAEPSAQITGSVDGGSSSLALVGDHINIGHQENNDFVGGEISGSGTLLIRSESSDVDIELGGTAPEESASLQITSGELAAIQPGFNRVVVGDKDKTSGITFGGDVDVDSSLTLESRGEINAQGHGLSVTGDVFLSAQQDVATGVVSTFGEQGLAINSKLGSVRVNGPIALSGGTVRLSARETVEVSDRITTSGSDRGGDIIITANNRSNAPIGVATGSLVTSSPNRGGNVSIQTTNGGIATADIRTANGGLAGEPSESETADETERAPGSVRLRSPGNISVELIDARSTLENVEDNTVPTRIDIDTRESFVASGTLENGASLSTTGTNQGNIRIFHGSERENAIPFVVGSPSENGTTGTIETTHNGQLNLIASADSPSSENNIQLSNRGIPLPEPPEPPLPQAPPEPEITVEQPQDAKSPVAIPEQTEDNVFARLETAMGEEFGDYLQLSEDGKQKPIATMAVVQDTLAEVEVNSGSRAALVYVYFVPDAESEASVIGSNTREVRPDDQLEIMLITREGRPVRRRMWGITRAQIERESMELRRRITSQFSSSRQYLPPAQQLYDWIVGPIAEDLQAGDIDSLGFVMDTGLRTLPIATLHDGDRYLVENYSLGVLPTFSLTEFESTGGARDAVDFDTTQVLAMGASRFEEQPDLPAVDAEVKLITEQLWEGDAFLNEDFVINNLRSQLQQKDYGIVHLATHATFAAGDLENSYIQLWNEQLSLNNLSDLELDNEDIRLIILSACNTALGDHSAEYGFAGIAVNAGPESALATLWPVSDEGTLGFMSQFYTELRGSATKAGALQEAQVRLINGELGIVDGEVFGPDGAAIATLPELAQSGQWDFSHPFYWSAFTMIGNPW